MGKILTWIIVLALIIGGGWYAWTHIFHKAGQQQSAEGGSEAQAGGGAPKPEVAVVTIASENVTSSKELPGRTSAFKVAEIRPQVSGIVTKRLFEEGSNVKAGQQLYQIDPAPFQAALESAKADILSAQANIQSVQARADRYAELVKIGGVSQQEYDDAKAGLAQANANVAVAQAALTTAQINLNYTKVFSPISGRIGKSMVTEGALVTANQAQALAIVQQLDPIYVDVTQSSAEMMELRRKAVAGSVDENGEQSLAMTSPVTLTIEGEKEPYAEEGRLQFSEVTVDPSTGMVQMRAIFPNSEQLLLPGLFVKARVAQVRMANAILVPQQSVMRNPDGSSIVMKVAGGKVAPQPVTVTEAIGDKWLVTSGLNDGDQVIVEGIMKAQPGSEVTTVDYYEQKAKEAQQKQQPAAPAAAAAESAEQPAAEPAAASDEPAEEPQEPVQEPEAAQE